MFNGTSGKIGAPQLDVCASSVSFFLQPFTSFFGPKPNHAIAWFHVIMLTSSMFIQVLKFFVNS
jgi:hypothetical protein